MQQRVVPLGVPLRLHSLVGDALTGSTFVQGVVTRKRFDLSRHESSPFYQNGLVREQPSAIDSPWSLDGGTIGTGSAYALRVTDSARLWRCDHDRYCITLTLAGHGRWHAKDLAVLAILVALLRRSEAESADALSSPDHPQAESRGRDEGEARRKWTASRYRLRTPRRR